MSAAMDGALVHYLRNAAGVAALVSARIYPGRAPSSANLSDGPYIIYMNVSRTRERHMGGGSGLALARYQLDAWAASYTEARALADAVRAALDNVQDEDMGAAGSTVHVDSAVLDNENDVFGEPTDGGQRAPSRVSLDFLIWHR